MTPQSAFREELIPSFDGTELYRVTEKPENARGTVVFLHGLGGHCRRFDRPLQRLLERGFRVVRYDHRGHGRSGGARAYIEDWRILVRDARIIVDSALEESPGPLFTWGYSMGGLIALLLGIDEPSGITGQVFLGACSEPLPLYRAFRRPQVLKLALKTSDSVGSDLLSRDPKVSLDYDRDPWVLHSFTNRLLYEVFVLGIDALAQSLPRHTLPCLTLHGGEDRVVPASSAQNIVSRSGAQDKTLELLPGFWHDLLHEPGAETVLSLASGWMEARLSI